MKALLDQLSQFIDLKLYYDGSSTPAASLQLVPAYDEEYEEWDVQACIAFASDGETYLIGNYFSEENFPEVIMALAGITEGMKEIVDIMEDKAERAIQSVAAAKQQTTATEFYTIDGRRTTQAAKGLKVVRMSDGTIRKVMAR